MGTATSMHTHTAIRRGMPEKVGRSAIFCATPTVKGCMKPEEKPMVSSKALAVSLTALGVASLGLLAVKNKKKSMPVSEIKKFTARNLSDEEKEKLIKELQAKTDDPDVKAEIRKLVENGEWDKL